MKKIAVFLYLICLAMSGMLYASQSQVFTSNITVPVVDKDIVFARNNAFGTLKRNLILQAVRELVDSKLLEEYKNTLLRNKKFSPNTFINFVKVINEVADGQKFSMGIEGEIDMDGMTDFLRRLNFIFKQDPLFPVTVVVDRDFPFSVKLLKERLNLFRIKVAAVHKISPAEPESETVASDLNDTESLFEKALDSAQTLKATHDKDVVNVEEMFSTYSQNAVLFLISTKLSTYDGASPIGVNIKILRKKDLQVINNIDHHFVAAITGDTTREQLAVMEEKFMKSISLQSCKRNMYDAGLESTINLEVYGINKPFLRDHFERDILKRNRNIQMFQLLRLTPELTEYKLRSKNQVKQLSRYFKRNHPFFSLKVTGDEGNTIQMEAVYTQSEEISNVKEWTPDDRILKEIRQALRIAEDVELPEEFIPDLTEQEPNNNSRQFNRLPSEQLVVSKVSSRADEDIYMVEGPFDQSNGIMIDWIRIGRTSLSPQLRLYDQDFKFLNNYLLLGRQKRLRFKYTFQDNPPTKIYIRISDKVGFIQGETGGYKSFNYLLKYKLAE